MPRFSSKVLAALAVALCVVLSLPVRSHGTQTNLKLILAISIDQMRFDYLTRFDPLFKGGFRRLLDRGAVFTAARYRHANTETGPGHAVILSGRHASHSGIVANDWYDSLLKKRVNVVDDPLHSPVGGEGRGASPINFIGFTLSDKLKVRSPRSRVVGVSLKDRSAILMTGRLADAAYWYETAGGRFITSTYYMRTPPSWLEEWNGRHFVDQFAGKKWERLNSDVSLYEKYAGPDAEEGEWDRHDTVFPHRIRSSPPDSAFYDDFRRTPFADEMTLEVALKAMQAHELGQDEFADLLAIGFSATDVIGHTYGPHSQEILDQLLRLDGVLERLFLEIDKRVGLENTWIVLSADHGAASLVEIARKHGLDARRLHPRQIKEAVDLALTRSFPGVTGIISYYDAPHFYLDETVLERKKLKRSKVESVIREALMKTGWVEVVYTHAQMVDGSAADQPYFSRFRNSFFESRSPHIIVCLKPYLYLDARVGGTGHGTPHDYDSHVPIIFFGSLIKAGRYDQPCGPEDIAPTLATLLGLDYPMESDSRVLEEMLK
ncbi:MAG: alkaline phosphatase family protein [Acidobacteriota bacterium]